MTDLAKLLDLVPEDDERLNSYTRKCLNEWQARILSQVPQVSQLNIKQIEADLTAYLKDDEVAEIYRCLADLQKWVSQCMTGEKGYYSYAYATWVISPMSRVESLMVKAYQAKIEKEKDKQKWDAAFRIVNPPLEDAKKYFSKDRYDEFKKAAVEAIEACVEKGEKYVDDTRASVYGFYLELLDDRKREEAQRVTANRAAQEYNRRLSDEKARLKALLSPNKKDHRGYFQRQVKDCRYTGQSFSQLLSREEEQEFDRTIVDTGKKKLDEIVSPGFRGFIDGKYWRTYFLLPRADYTLGGVPCLDFGFDVFAVLEIGVWLKPGRAGFGDYLFDFPWRVEKGHSVTLKEPEFLGYQYFVLTPEDLGYSFWQRIPLILLRGLLNGEGKPDGTTISAASDSGTTYKVQRFGEEIDIPDEFADYLRSAGSIDGMVSWGIITDKVAGIVKAELSQLKAEHEVLSQEGIPVDKDSRKAKAFELFSEGRRPSDPEVKSLGIKPNSTYRYYQLWKKAHSGTES